MNALLKEDQAKRPDVFRFAGKIEPTKLDTWLGEHAFVVPEDLRLCWVETGGGELFETETLLSPFGRKDLGDDVETLTTFHWEKGMPRNWIIFHTGIGGLTVAMMPSGGYASVSPDSYTITQTFDSLSSWYTDLLRNEYAARYGLVRK